MTYLRLYVVSSGCGKSVFGNIFKKSVSFFFVSLRFQIVEVVAFWSSRQTFKVYKKMNLYISPELSVLTPYTFFLFTPPITACSPTITSKVRLSPSAPTFSRFRVNFATVFRRLYFLWPLCAAELMHHQNNLPKLPLPFNVDSCMYKLETCVVATMLFSF